MERIFHEQCEVQEEKVTVKDKTGNTVMQNPSDPDATLRRPQRAGLSGPDRRDLFAGQRGAVDYLRPAPDGGRAGRGGGGAGAGGPEGVPVVAERIAGGHALPQRRERPARRELRRGTGRPGAGRRPGRAAGRSDDRRLRHRREDRAGDLLSGRSGAGALGAPSGQRPDPHHDAGRGLRPVCLPPPVSGRKSGRTAIIWSTRPSSGGWRAGGGNSRRRSFASGIAAAVASRAPTAASNGARAWAACGCGAGRGSSRRIYLKITGWNILRASVCAKMRELVRAKAQTAVFWATAGLRTVSGACRKAFQGLPTVISVFHYPLLPGRSLRQAA